MRRCRPRTALREQKDAANKAAEQHKRQAEQQGTTLREAETARDKLKTESEKLASKLQARFDEIAKLTSLLQAAESASAAKTKELAETREVQKRLSAEAEALRKQLAEEAAKAKKQTEAAQRAVLRQLGQTVISLLGYSPEQPMTKGELRRLVARINDVGLVDSRWYLQRYKDVADFGMDPSVHYLLFGAREGREPSDPSKAVHGADAAKVV